MSKKINKFPVDHVVIESRKEIWCRGSSTLAMGLESLVNKYYPGYRGCLASADYFARLKSDPSILEHEQRED
jgi:hypothetical protein